MTTLSVRRYTLDDYERISSEGFNYTIDSATHDIIDALVKEVGAPDYVRTPIFTSNRERPRNGNGNGNGSRNRRRHQEISDDDWECIRTFQSRDKQDLSATEKLVRKIRDIANRITSTNCDNGLVEEIRNVLFESIERECSNEVISALFAIFGKSKLNRTSYVNLVCDLLDTDEEQMCDIILTALENFIKEWVESFRMIEEVNEDEDFDKFCDMNKVNDLRLIKSAFIGELYGKFQLLIENQDDLSDKLENIVSIISCQIVFPTKELLRVLVLENNSYIVEQIGYCIDKIFDNDYICPSDISTEDGESLQDILEKIVSCGRAEYPSLSNKLLFKLMAYVS